MANRAATTSARRREPLLNGVIADAWCAGRTLGVGEPREGPLYVEKTYPAERTLLSAGTNPRKAGLSNELFANVCHRARRPATRFCRPPWRPHWMPGRPAPGCQQAACHG